MRRRNGLALLMGVLMTGAAVGGTAIYSHATDVLENASSVQEVQTAEADHYSGISTVELTSSGNEFSYANVADVAESVMPSIVAITNKSVQEVRSFFYGQPIQYEATSAGSGIIVGSNDTELLICTNNHVVEDATELTVSFIDEESYPAEVKGTDPDNDLAVVAVKLEDISDDTMDQIKIARIGSADEMRVGEQVVAIGNALGYGQSVTTGIISAKDRSISASSGSDSYSHLIQTDAAINPGNSGGALLNMNGEVIGINSAKASSSAVEGMGYAISVDQAMPILNELMSQQTREKLESGRNGYIGINGQSVSADATMLYGIPAGVYVTSVAQDSPAAKAGLQEGDIITAFDGLEISSMETLQDRLQYYAPGEAVEIDVYTKSGSESSGYAEETLTVTLGDREQLQ